MLKERLGLTSVLQQLDASRAFQLHTDWSALGVGAVLTQKDDEKWKHVVAFASKSNSNVESNYSSYQGEALEAIWAIAHFQPYLYGQ